LPWPSTSHRDRLLKELASTFHNRGRERSDGGILNEN
jgi:hypothetical protein